jgi:6,7-dimethyl-8-ribityllumazine synthase
MKVIEGSLTPPTGKFALVAARFNQRVVQSLVDGAYDTLVRHGVSKDDVVLHWVPGSFEIPLVAHAVAACRQYVAVICLGAVIRGDTDHYDHVAGSATSGVAQAGIATGIPVIFGILTCDTVEQALNRAGLKSGNKGAEAALAAIEMANLLKQLE